MKIQPFFNFKIIVSLALLTFFVFWISPVRGNAQIEPFNLEFDPPDRGRPNDRDSAGGDRGGCDDLETALIDSDIPLVALTPLSEDYYTSSLPEDKESTLGYTIDEFPSMWLYIPELPPEISDAQFSLIAGDKTHEESISLPRGAGVFHFRSNYPLELNQYYHWSFKLICGSKKIGVDAWIERIQLDSSIRLQLENKTDIDRLQTYAENGVWHETIELLAKLRCQNQNDEVLANNWKKLLEFIGDESWMTEVTEAEILNCETLVQTQI